jgi:hypothetical protein
VPLGIARALALGALIATVVTPASVQAFSAEVRADAGVCGGVGDNDIVVGSFSATAEATSAGTCTRFPAQGAFLAAVGAGTASLATGHLTAFAGAVGFDSLGGAAGCCVAAASGRADLFDVITIHGPAPVFATTAELHLVVDGDTSGFSSAQAYISLNDGLLFGPASVFQTRCKGGFGCVDNSVPSTAGSFAFDIVMNVPVSSGSPSFAFRSGIFAQAVNEGDADIRGSGQLSLVLPAGFTFTSQSGVLLSGSSDVPEPSSLLLLLCGAGTLGLACRRRRPGSSRQAAGGPARLRVIP